MAQVRKKIVSQNTLDSKKIRVGAKGEKIKCDYCNSKVLDMARHLLKCYRNPKNSPQIKSTRLPFRAYGGRITEA